MESTASPDCKKIQIIHQSGLCCFLLCFLQIPFSLCVCVLPIFSFVIPSGNELPHLYSTSQPCCWHGFCAFLFFLCFYGQGSAIVHPQTVLKTWLVPLIDFLWWISFEYPYILIYKIWLKSSFIHAVSVSSWNLSLSHTHPQREYFGVSENLGAIKTSLAHHMPGREGT